MPNLSPQPPVSSTVPSPRPTAPPPARPGLLKRHSSTSTPGYNRGMASNAVSPGSHTDSAQPLRHQVARGKHGHHARLVVPRGHGSRTNLAKMGGGRQAQSQLQLQGYVGEGTRPDRQGRQRSHEGDTEIRLPGSLDESAVSAKMESARPQMKRNLTAYQLPRNLSHGKLKKNFSHGALQRLGNKGGGGVAGAQQQSQQQQRAPPSPGLRGKSKGRPKSADFGKLDQEREVDLHEQEVELARRLKEGKEKKGSGFKLGSMGDDDTSEEEEEEWTEESASASPYSTRQNTANNSRRASTVKDRSTQLEPIAGSRDEADEQEGMHMAESKKEVQQASNQAQKREEENEDDENDDEEEEEDQTDSDEPASPRSQPHIRLHAPLPDTHPTKPVISAKEHHNPTTSFLRRQSEQHIAPAQISNITATDTTHSNTPSTQSPTPISSQQQRSTDRPRHESQDDGEQTEELISRFIPSTSQPQSVPHSNPTTNANNTPAQSFRQPPHPVSPGGSTISASSGAATPSASTMKGRSRIELKMLSEKALADLEDNATRQPVIPAHVYDRRNESLKSYLNLASLGMGGPDIRVGGPAGHFQPGGAQYGGAVQGLSPNQIGSLVPTGGDLRLGPEIFQGRFNAVQQELRVVQKFRDPLRESMARLRNCSGSKLNTHPTGPGKLKQSPHKSNTGLRGSKSAVSLPLRSVSHGASRSTGQLPPPGTLDGASTSQPTSLSRPVSRQSTAPKRQSQLQLSTSSSPPRTAMKSSGPSQNGSAKGSAPAPKRAPSRGVSFAGGDPVIMPQGSAAGMDEVDGAEEIARRLWEGVGV